MSKTRLLTLESGINVPPSLLIFEFFSRGYGLITDYNTYILPHRFAHFKEATSIPDSKELFQELFFCKQCDFIIQDWNQTQKSN